MVVTVVVRTARPRNRTQSDEAAAGRFFTTRNFICCCSNPSQLPATAADHKTAHWPPVPTRSSAEENFALFRTREKKTKPNCNLSSSSRKHWRKVKSTREKKKEARRTLPRRRGTDFLPWTRPGIDAMLGPGTRVESGENGPLFTKSGTKIKADLFTCTTRRRTNGTNKVRGKIWRFLFVSCWQFAIGAAGSNSGLISGGRWLKFYVLNYFSVVCCESKSKQKSCIKSWWNDFNFKILEI